MEVYFDYQIFFYQQYGGISKYIVELCNALGEIKDCKPFIHAPFHRSSYFSEIGNKNFIKNILKYSPDLSRHIFRRYRKINDLFRFIYLKKNPNVILHETFYSHCVKKKVSHRVITVYDMMPELFLTNEPQFKSVIREKREAIERADLIISISESTKRDLIKLHPALADKIHVTHLGVRQVDIGSIKIYHSSAPYILYVGKRDYYKNFITLLKTYLDDEEIHGKFQLICYGGSKFDDEENNLISKAGLEKKVIRLYGNDDLLNSLYKSAECFVYPSTYEGFGLPVLEAMALNCPVICANTSSLPEVAGDAALLIDTTSQKEISTAIKKITSDVNLRKQLIAKGAERIKQFTWRSCAEKTYKVYQTMLENK